jgi:hypothetical protein
MRNHRESVCRSAQKGRQVTKRSDPQAALGIIRAGEQDFSDGIIGPIADATLYQKQRTQQRPSKDNYEDSATDSSQQIDSKRFRAIRGKREY